MTGLCMDSSIHVSPFLSLYFIFFLFRKNNLVFLIFLLDNLGAKAPPKKEDFIRNLLEKKILLF